MKACHSKLTALTVCLLCMISLLAGCGYDLTPAQSTLPSPLPVWSGETASTRTFIEPPVPNPPTVMLAITSVTSDAMETIFRGIHSLSPAVVPQYQLAVFFRSDVEYLQSNSSILLNNDGTFVVTVPRAIGTTTRATIILAPITSDLMSSPGCNRIAGYCNVPTDPVTKISLPVAQSLMTAYTAYYFPPVATSSDPQIAALQTMMGGFPIANNTYGSGQLIRSYRDINSAFLYDQALAVIAFSKAGDRTNAELILNALTALQESSGAWQFSYYIDGEAAQPGTDERIAGANAWTAIAFDTYQATFSSTKYLSASTRLHNYLLNEITSVTVNGIPRHGIRFAPTDYLPGRTTLYAFEHQIDTYAALSLYFQLNGGSTFQQAANQLRDMAESLWNGSRFLAGYDGSTNAFNTTERYLDTYTWGILALGNIGSTGQDFARALPTVCDFFTTNGTLYYPSRQLNGAIGFFDLIVNNIQPSSGNRFVWSEGTLGVLSAMQQAEAAGYSPISCLNNKRADILASLIYMHDPLGGMPYATQNSNTDFTSSSSVAGTAWLYFVNHRINPYYANRAQ